MKNTFGCSDSSSLNSSGCELSCMPNLSMKYFSPLYMALYFFFRPNEKFILSMNVSNGRCIGVLLSFKKAHLYFSYGSAKCKHEKHNEVSISVVEELDQPGITVGPNLYHKSIIKINSISYLMKNIINAGICRASDVCELSFAYIAIKYYMNTHANGNPASCYSAKESNISSYLLNSLKSIYMEEYDFSFYCVLNSLIFLISKKFLASKYSVHEYRGNTVIYNKSWNKAFCCNIVNYCKSIKIGFLKIINGTESKIIFSFEATGCVSIDHFTNFLRTVKNSCAHSQDYDYNCFSDSVSDIRFCNGN